jgi:type IV pilus assembly protein PilA
MNYTRYRNHIQVQTKGFTLVEVMLVIGLIGILAGMVIVAINPVRQFKVARDTERQTHILALMNAVNANMSEHSGIFTCNGIAQDLPTTTLKLVTSDQDGLDIRSCLVPAYLGELPQDPKTGRAYSTASGYSTGYLLGISSTTGSLILEAQGEIDSRITVGR